MRPRCTRGLFVRGSHAKEPSPNDQSLWKKMFFIGWLDTKKMHCYDHYRELVIFRIAYSKLLFLSTQNGLGGGGWGSLS